MRARASNENWNNEVLDRPIFFERRTFSKTHEEQKGFVPSFPQVSKASSDSAPQSVDDIIGNPILSDSARAKRLKGVSEQIQSSINAKTQAENTISREISSLRRKLAGELEEEALLKKEITSLIEDLSLSISSRKSQLDTEKKLLGQMRIVKSQIKEKVIFDQLDAAEIRKADLIAIEAVLLEDLESCKAQIVEEQMSTVSRINMITKTLQNLPTDSDVQSTKTYSWKEVEDLQNVLIEAIDSLQQRDAKIGMLKTKYAYAIKEKAVVLGEVDVFVGESDFEANVKQPEAPISTSNPTSVKITLSPDMTQQDILQMAGSSSIDALKESVNALGIASNKLGSWIKSEDGQQSAADAIDAIEATKQILPSFANAMKAAKKEWDSSFKGEEMVTFDVLLEGVKNAITSVIFSKDVKNAMEEFQEYAARAGKKTASATSKTFNAIKVSATDESVLSSLSKSIEDLQKTIIALAAAGTKVVNEMRPSLPPSKK